MEYSRRTNISDLVGSQPDILAESEVVVGKIALFRVLNISLNGLRCL